MRQKIILIRAGFGMLKKKFAEMVLRAWEADTVSYMVAGSIDMDLKNSSSSDIQYFEILQKVIEDHAIEASISKNSLLLLFCDLFPLERFFG